MLFIQWVLLILNPFYPPTRQGSGDIAIILVSVQRRNLVHSKTLIPFEIFDYIGSHIYYYQVFWHTSPIERMAKKSDISNNNLQFWKREENAR